MGLKRGAIGNTLEEHIGNLMGTRWELERNMLGTKGKWKKRQVGRWTGNGLYGKRKARHHHAGGFTPGNMASEPNKQNVPGLKFFFFFFFDIHISLGQYGNGHLHGLYIFIYLNF
jgi:hypothetical protein